MRMKKMPMPGYGKGPIKRSVDGASKIEKTGNVKKGPKDQARYSSGAPKRGTQTRSDLLREIRALDKYVRTFKFAKYSDKQKVWAQIDNYRVALGTLKESNRKSKSNATGTSTYDNGKVKVRKEAGFSRDSGRGGGRKSTQMADGGGKKTTTKGKPGSPNPRPVYVNVGQSMDYAPFDSTAPEKSKRTAAEVTKTYVRMPAEKAKQGESRKDYILRKNKEGLAKGGTRGR
jgi:hypothetical protein